MTSVTSTGIESGGNARAEVFSGDNSQLAGVWNETIAVGAPFKDEHATWNVNVALDTTAGVDDINGAVYLFQQSNSSNSVHISPG